MNKAIWLAMAVLWISACQNRGWVIHPLGERDLLLFLDNDEWAVTEVCIEGNCKAISGEENLPFGIETSKIVPNYCSDEKGDFYTIGLYYWHTNPITYEIAKSFFSCPDYFKIVRFSRRGSHIQIKLCTPNGYYPGKLEVVDGFTIKITANRPEYDDKEVVMIYKKP